MMQSWKVTQLVVSEQQISELKSALLSPESSYPAEETIVEPTDISTSPDHLILATGEHCPDDIFVGYTLGMLSEEEQQRVAKHLSQCRTCADEMERLRHFSGIWEDPSTQANLQRRILSKLRWERRGMPLPLYPSPIWTPLRTLLAKDIAYGQGQNDSVDTETVRFLIVDASGVVIAGLSGQLERHQNEYFARINVVNEGNETGFEDRTVLVTIVDQEEILLRRRLDVGVTVLLGTGIPLTNNSTIAGYLLESDDFLPSQNPSTSQH